MRCSRGWVRAFLPAWSAAPGGPLAVIGLGCCADASAILSAGTGSSLLWAQQLCRSDGCRMGSFKNGRCSKDGALSVWGVGCGLVPATLRHPAPPLGGRARPRAAAPPCPALRCSALFCWTWRPGRLLLLRLRKSSDFFRRECLVEHSDVLDAAGEPVGGLPVGSLRTADEHPVIRGFDRWGRRLGGPLLNAVDIQVQLILAADADEVGPGACSGAGA